MQYQFNNNIIPSFLLAVDNKLLSQGYAYTNYSGLLYPVTGSYNGYYLYSTPFRQLVNDISITGANIMSGIYNNNSFITSNAGLASINISEGIVYSTGILNSPSGIYSIKDFGVYLSNLPEEKLLFETKYSLRSEIVETLSGLAPDIQTCPIVFIKSLSNENEPFALGGVDKKVNNIRCIVLGDSQFITDAACSILEDMAHKYIKIVDVQNLPFDAFGGFSGINYNYNNLDKINQSYIWSAKTSKLFDTRELNNLNPAIFPAFVDFELWSWK